jgi:hypothetical protein
MQPASNPRRHRARQSRACVRRCTAADSSDEEVRRRGYRRISSLAVAVRLRAGRSTPGPGPSSHMRRGTACWIHGPAWHVRATTRQARQWHTERSAAPIMHDALPITWPAECVPSLPVRTRACSICGCCHHPEHARVVHACIAHVAVLISQAMRRICTRRRTPGPPCAPAPAPSGQQRRYADHGETSSRCSTSGRDHA